MSPWPIIVSGGVLVMFLGVGISFHGGGALLGLLGGLFAFVSVLGWWRDVGREGGMGGFHTLKVVSGLRMGMGLFICSEVMLFFGFFWSYLHNSLSGGSGVGDTWPPMGVEGLDPFGLPLLNTLILLGSGVSVTWAHFHMVSGKIGLSVWGIMLTCALGWWFSGLQWVEYVGAGFGLWDSVYSSCFYCATGLHGCHVLVGSIYLVVSGLRMGMGSCSSGHHFGLEGAIWYWHFVDVVWLFLFVLVYWWGY